MAKRKRSPYWVLEWEYRTRRQWRKARQFYTSRAAAEKVAEADADDGTTFRNTTIRPLDYADKVAP